MATTQYLGDVDTVIGAVRNQPATPTGMSTASADGMGR